MKDLSAVIVINRPVEEVFAYAIDLNNDANWRKSVDKSAMRPGQAAEVGGVGYSLIGDQEAEWKIIAYEPESYTVTWEFVNGPILGQAGYRTTAVEGGTEFTLYVNIEPAGALRYLKPLFNWFVDRQNQGDVEKLKQILEAAPE
jgi:uncharacterized membrane protein